MTLKEYLTNCTVDELTNRLIQLDASIMALHQRGFYIVSFDANNIQLYDDELTLESFNNKIDYLNSGINPNGDKLDILEMCAIGICAYNKFNNFYINKEFLFYLMNNFKEFENNEKIPKSMLDYYNQVLTLGNIDYLNNYLMNKGRNNQNSKSVSKSYSLTKSTAIGRAFAEKDRAYVNVLLIPAIITFIYVFTIVLLMVVRYS